VLIGLFALLIAWIAELCLRAWINAPKKPKKLKKDEPT
jgi:hypothetical protein